MGSCQGPRVAVVSVVLSVVVVGIVALAPAAAASAGGYRPPVDPVDGVITDHFRAPGGPYGAGNRGLDYRTVPLSPVHAAADGVVIFAGPVAGTLHITIRHADGLRTTYSFLASIDVEVGASVHQGDVIAATSDVFHFGVRDPDGTYLDPELLFAGEGSWHVRLVPGGDDGTQTPVTDGLPTLTPDRLAGLRRWAHAAAEGRPELHAARVASGLADWYAHRDDCTQASTPVTAPAGRRIVVEIAGIGSTSGDAAIDHLDTATLGYGAGDVVRFSYRGGRVPATTVDPAFRAVPARAYDARDSQQDLETVAARLVELVRAIAAAAPGVPIDLVGHSQGGLVARLALEQAGAAGTLPPEVTHLVTLGTPHGGADVAAIVAAGRTTRDGRAFEEAWRRVLGLDLDPALPAAGQLVPTSDLLRDVAGSALPPRVHLTSIGARGDVVVTANRTIVSDPGARNTVVALSGIEAHDRLPASAEATREIALAVADLPPTCRSLAQVLADLTESETLSLVEATAAIGVQRSAAAARFPLPEPTP